MDWDITISSKHKLLDLKVKELVRYHDLILMFFIRDFTTTYKQTVLGPLWYIISPLCSTLIYTFTFGNIAAISTDGIPHLLFYFGGTMLWTFFTTCLLTASNIFILNAHVFGKVYFPRLAAPIATTFSSILKLFIQFVILMVFLVYFIITGSHVRPSINALLFPVLIIWIGALGTGLGMVFSALTTKYRDLSHVLGLAVQLAMFVTPVVYPLSQIPQNMKYFFYLNPVSAPMELFRIWFYGAGNVPFLMILCSIITTVLVVLVGLILFTRMERTFMDVI